MIKFIKNIFFLFALMATFLTSDVFAQSKKPAISKRAAEKKAMHSRDSLIRSLNRSDTSITGLLQRVEQYTTTFNQINSNLSEGLDTADVSQGLPPVTKRLNKIDSLLNTHKSSTLRYLFVLRDNLDHIQNSLEGWQSDMEDISTKLIQNQNDLIKFSKDTTLKFVPADSALMVTFFAQRSVVRKLYHKTDSANRCSLTKVNLIQDKLSISYTKILDETDQIDLKIKRFAMKAISGESSYIWELDSQYNDFGSAFKSTIKLNKLLFNYFTKSETQTHAVAILFLVLAFSWIIYIRSKTLKNSEQPELVFEQARFIYSYPIMSSLLLGTAITPYFYDHPPVVFLELLFLISIIFSLILTRKYHRHIFSFLRNLFFITLVYLVSNLFIQISNVDRYVIFVLSIISLVYAFQFLKRAKQAPEDQLPYTQLALKLFIGLQVLSLLLNISGRFSLAKIVGVTSVFNLWLLVILMYVVQTIEQGLFLQFQVKKASTSFISWIDYNIVKKKFNNVLVTLSALVWTFFLLQNLNIDDWIMDNIGDILNDSRSVGGASFTLGGFIIFIAVIWVSSVVSKIISYFYDVSATRVNDFSVAKKKNRTSTLLIRLGVFSVGFLLAVAASGFPLEKLTIIISAFGIGIGFGLQNIVNNLVSGLILAFEKPINIGDVIEVDGVSGTMREIGIRSSKIATGDGSEVIIPNGDLISHHVTNWTLSNTNRQVSILVNTAYGVDIDKVKDLLKNLLCNRDDIMASPSPAVFVNNVNPATVEFKVLFWAADINNVSTLKSKVFADIYREIKEQEIEMPSPQKDYYLHFPDGGPVLGIDKKTEQVNEPSADKTANKTAADRDQ